MNEEITMIPFNKYYDQTLKEKSVNIDYDEDGNEIDANRDSVIPKKEISNKGDFVVRNGKMLFNRVGPISGQVQTNKKAPSDVRRGVWAMPFPIFDYFLAGGKSSFPAQMAPKNPNYKKLDSQQRTVLQQVLNKNIERMKEIKRSVPNFKDIYNYNKDLAREYNGLEYDNKELEDYINSKDPVFLYVYYRLIGKENEYEKIEKPLPKAQLSDIERRDLEKKKKDIERAMAALKPKIDGDNKHHPLKGKYDELEYKLSDINELLGGEGSKDLKHTFTQARKEHVKIRKFFYGGPIYARFNDKGEVIGSGGSGEWYKFENVKMYLDALRKQIKQYTDSHKDGWGDKKSELELIKTYVRGINAIGGLGSDHLEVFLPM